MTMQEFIQGLRNAADFFEAHPEIGMPGEPCFSYYGDVNEKSVDSREGLAEFARIVGGRIDKDASDHYLTLTAKKRGFTLRAVAIRSQVCQQVAVGTKIEPAHTIPAQAEMTVPEREVPVYEWRCPSILAGEGEPVQDAEPLNHLECY